MRFSRVRESSSIYGISEEPDVQTAERSALTSTASLGRTDDGWGTSIHTAVQPVASAHGGI